jgi:N-formylglutamate deformylase
MEMVNGRMATEMTLPSHVADLPADPITPVVVSVPHAGVEIAGFAAPLDPALDVRCDADLYVDELYDGAPRGAFVRARLSRFVCDLNRHADDVSARAVPEHPAPRNRDGRGFVWEVTTTGRPTLRRPLTLAEWQARKAVHDAYYGALAQALDRAKRKFGFAILVDGHSMPSVGRAGHADPGHERADVVPGDRVGTSCSPRLSAAVTEHFRGAGFSVAMNDPYRGGFITQHHGRPQDRVHAIQIEMRRDLYMDEATFARRPEGFARLRGALAALLRELDALDLGA